MQKIYRKIKWLHSIRFSPFIITCWLFFNSSIRKQLSLKRKFYQQLLKDSSTTNKLIFDVGANEGFITKIFSELNFTVVAVEPDEKNIRILKNRFRKNNSINIEPLALGSEEGVEKLYIPRRQHALTTLSKKWKHVVESHQHKNADEFINEVQIKVITLDKLIEKYGSPAYVKIDVEGSESEVLKGLTLPVHLLSFECILPLFYEETLDCLQHLISLNKNYAFNISYSNKFLFPEFVPIEKVREKIRRITDTVEVFASANI